MKAVVVELHNKTVAILSDKGCVIEIKNDNYAIGQEVFITMKKQKSPTRIFSYAAAACLLLFLGYGTYAYASPSTYISLDVNPSIEYSLNRFDRVLSVYGVNEDGTELLDEIEISNLKHKNIEDAISLTIDQLSNDGYLDSEESGIIITTFSNDFENDIALAEKLEAAANEGLEKNNRIAIVMSEVIDSEQHQLASDKNVTPGKMILVERLAESAGSENIDDEEWLQKSVKDIINETNQYREEIKMQEKTQDETQDKSQEQTKEKIQEGEKNPDTEVAPNKDASSTPQNNNGFKEENGEGVHLEQPEPDSESENLYNDGHENSPYNGEPNSPSNNRN